LHETVISFPSEGVAPPEIRIHCGGKLSKSPINTMTKAVSLAVNILKHQSEYQAWLKNYLEKEQMLTEDRQKLLTLGRFPSLFHGIQKLANRMKRL
tara:strand:- start:35 stop:322 length:288 start_codon:yes stop_codon:yes gene_type:complete